MKKIIIGFTSLIAGGKGTAAAHIQSKYGAETFRFSTMLRDVLSRLYLPETRENLSDISRILRERFGQDLMAKVMAKDAESSGTEIIIVEGIRRQEDIVHLRKLENFTLVAITADEKKRYERLLTRGENEDDATKTWEDFIADHQRETEVSIPPVMAQADVVIENDGSVEAFYMELDNLITNLRARKV